MLTVGCLIDSGMNSRAEKRRIFYFLRTGKGTFLYGPQSYHVPYIFLIKSCNLE